MEQNFHTGKGNTHCLDMSSSNVIMPGEQGTKTFELKRSVAAALSTVLSERMLPRSTSFLPLAAFSTISRQQHPLAILTSANSSGLRPLHFAAATNNTSLLQNLLEVFAQAFPEQFRMLLDCRDKDGNTALHWSVMKGSLNTFAYLVKVGATVNVANLEGRTALHMVVSLVEYLSEETCGQMINLLLHHGADPNITDQTGTTPLHLASELGSVSLIEFLLEEGANVNVIDDEGETALFYALRGQRDAAVRKLVEYGIDVTTRNSDGESALDFCISIGDATMVQLLESLQLPAEKLPVLNPLSLSMELSGSNLSASSGLWFSGNEIKSSF